MRIGRGLVRVVAPLLPVKIHRRIPGIVRRNVALLILSASLGNSSVPPRPRISVPSTVKCSSDNNSFARACSITCSKKCFGDLAFQQPLPVLGEHRHVPHLVVHAQPHEPPETAGCSPSAPSASAHCVRCRAPAAASPQQLLRGNRWPSVVRVQLRKLRRHLLQRRVHHSPQPT